MKIDFKFVPSFKTENSLNLNKSIYFMHIPKSGGTTIDYIFAEISKVLNYFKFKKYKHDKKLLDTNKIKLNSINKTPYFISGHLNSNFTKNIDNIYKCTVVREPIQRVVSHYKFMVFKKNITPNNLKNISKLKSSTSIIKLLTNQNIEKEFLLKIDIEGNEYAILEDIIKVQSKLTGLVLEFHNCFIMREHIQNFLNKINLDLVHIHVNNYGEVTKDDFPNVIEMTFSKRIYNYLRKKDEFKFPNNLLDSPNNPKFEDKEITFEQ